MTDSHGEILKIQCWVKHRVMDGGYTRKPVLPTENTSTHESQQIVLRIHGCLRISMGGDRRRKADEGELK